VINHLRTLLLDEDGTSWPGGGYPGEEYVPPEFRRRPMPMECRNPWRVLFGSNPDRAYKNFRLRQYMTVLHTSDLAPEVLAFDSRVTYWPLRASDKRFDGFGTTTVSALPQTVGELLVGGQLTANDGRGQSRFEWRVSVESGNRVSVNYHQFDVTFTDGLSNAFTIGQGLTGRVRENVDDAWVVEALARPGRDLGAVVATLTKSLGASEAFLFGPEQELGELWRRHDFLPLKLSALLVALGRRIEESR
jgi:hypothetical protein